MHPLIPQVWTMGLDRHLGVGNRTGLAADRGRGNEGDYVISRVASHPTLPAHREETQ